MKNTNMAKIIVNKVASKLADRNGHARGRLNAMHMAATLRAQT